MSPSVTNVIRTIRHTTRLMVRELGLLDMPPQTMPRCHALIELSEQGALSVNQLADRLRIDKSYASRITSALVKDGLAAFLINMDDRRQKPVVLTHQGEEAVAAIHLQADQQVAKALTCLAPSEKAAVLTGLSLYAKALTRSRLKASFTIRPILLADNPGLAEVIRAVLTEFGANKPGFAFADPELDYMYETYNQPRSGYWVIEHEGQIVGGGGFAPLRNGPADVCEIQKMYILPDYRGYGLAADILGRCLEGAAAEGFTGCYLETLKHMDRAQKLYAAYGFAPISSPVGNTGHCGCDTFYYRTLEGSLVQV